MDDDGADEVLYIVAMLPVVLLFWRRVSSRTTKNLSLLWLAALFSTLPGFAQQLAFPGAQGFGQYATGGRNGTVYHVTTLADSGTGSFRDAVSQPNRTIVFDVGGTITLASAVSCSSSLTIAGQTAPGGGIAVIGHEVSFSVRTNEIVRFVRFRPGSTASSTEDGINMGDGTNMIYDHISVEFAPYNNIDAHGNYTGGNMITVQSSVLADPIGQQFNAHTEALYNTFSWCYDILSSAHNRNPLAKVNTIFVNNVVYNYQAGYTVADTSGDFSHDIVNNYFITGPSTTSASDDFFQMDANQSIYAAGNLLDSADNGTLGGSPAAPGGVVVLGSPWSSLTPDIPTFSAAAAYKNDVSLSGALPRDQVDQLVISDVSSLGTSGQMWTSQTATSLGNNGYGTITGGATPLNTSGDGIPDYWKLANGLNVNTSYPLTNTADGYTLLEHYLNWLATPHATTDTNTPIEINLTQYTAGFASGAVYTVSGASNGVVSLTNGSTAVFVPKSNFAGLGSFVFTVNDGIAQTNTVGICITPESPPQSLIWRGDGVLNNWDTVSTNWLNGTNLAAFAQDDTVTFSDAGSDNPPVNLVGTLTPAAINVSSTQNYTFSGDGDLSGPALFSKSGPGTLTINTTNSGYSGNFDITGGTLAVGNSGNIGTGNFLLSGNATLDLLGGSVLLSVPGTITVAAGNTATLASAQLGNEFSGNLISGDSNSILNLSGGVSFNGSASSQFSDFTGTINIPTGSSLRFALASSGNNFGSLNPNFVINGGLQPRNAGNTITLGTLNGSGQLAGPQTSGTGSGNTVYIVGGNNQNGNFSGTIVSNAASAGSAICFEKVGGGTQVLGGNNTITGTNAVTAGTLVLNGINDNWLTTVFPGATLEGTGVINGALTVNNGGILMPGINGTGTFTVNGALTNNSPTLVFGLTNSPAGPNGLIRMTGPLVLSGLQTFNFILTGGTLADGTYPLISGGNSMTLSSATLADNLAPDARQSYTLTTPASGSSTGYVSLVVAGLPPAALVWEGTNGSSWDLVTTNWLNDSFADRFYNLDNVTFTDMSTNGTVNLTATLQPGAIIVTNNTIAYVFGGSGGLAGAGTLTKSGPGTLSILATNTSYTGNIFASGGMLAIGNSTALGTGVLTLSNEATFDLMNESSGVFYSSPIFVPAGQNATLNSSSLGNGFEGALSSGDDTSVLNITGSASFGATNSTQFDGFTGTINIQPAATLRFAADGSGNTYGSLNPTLVINGALQPRNAGNTVQLGAISGSGTLKGPQSNAGSGNTLFVIGGNNSNATFSGVIQSNSAVAGSLVILNKVGTGVLTLSGNNTYSGGTTVTAGTLAVDNTAGSGTGTGDMEIMSGATLSGNGIIGSATTMDAYSTLAPGSPAGTLTFSNNLSLENTSTLLFGLGTNSSQVNVNGSLFLAGNLVVTNTGGFGVGIYPLFTYNTANGLSLGSLAITSAPAGYNYSFNTNTPGVVKLVAAPTIPPSFSQVALEGNSLTLSGDNGLPLENYVVLVSSNLLSWTPAATNQFDENGRFSFTTNLPAGQTQSFYRLELP